jgi:hypothetical protein
MERTGRRIAEGSIRAARTARRLHAGWLLLGGALALGGCYVVPAQSAYIAPGPVYVAPAPVYVAPAPVYVWGGYRYRYGWRRHGHW